MRLISAASDRNARMDQLSPMHLSRMAWLLFGALACVAWVLNAVVEGISIFASRSPPAINASWSRTSRHAKASLSEGIKSAGKGFARARDRAAFCPRDPPSPAAETGNATPARAKVAENRGLSQRPQETGLVQDCVVGPAGLEPATKWLRSARSAPNATSRSRATDLNLLPSIPV